MNNEKYRELCKVEKSIPLFSQAWWLDTVCGEDNWDVCLVEKGGKINASMPYYTTKKYGFTFLTHPSLTQNLGPWLRPSNAKYSKRLGQEKDLMQALILQLPDYDYFSQSWHYSNTNWLAFYWQGFQQTTKVTYKLPDLSSSDAIWQEFQANIRTDIRKAEKQGVAIKEDASIDEFLLLNKKVFERQNQALPYSEELVRNIHQACSSNQCSKIFLAQDPDGKHHAAVYIIWDEHSAYYLMGGSDPELRNSGATSFCMWEAIKFSAAVTESFDFEGSMIEPVERFFRAFGAKQTPYFAISKNNSKLLDLALTVKALFR